MFAAFICATEIEERYGVEFECFDPEKDRSSDDAA